MRLATWNVNSVTARLPRLLDWLGRAEPDVVCLQEVKCADTSFPHEEVGDLGYQAAVHGAGRWNGVAVLSRVGIDDVRLGLADEPGYLADNALLPAPEQRAMGATCGGIRLWSVYVPNGREVGHAHYAYKLQWLASLRATVAGELSTAAPRPFAVLGDFNIAPTDADVWDASLFRDSTHVTPAERAALADLEAEGLADVVPRALKHDVPFTYWDYRRLAFPHNHGMRIDLVLGDDRFRAAVTDAYVDRDARKGTGTSDHAPVVVDLTWPVRLILPLPCAVVEALRGLLGLVFLLLVAWAFSRHRRGVSVRTVAAALALQVAFAALVLRSQPGKDALEWASDRVATLIGYSEEGTSFVFGPLLGVGDENETIFALQVLPVIIFLGALIGLLFYLRVIQYLTYVIGGAIAWLLGVSKVESMYASTVIFLGQSEAPLMIAPYLKSLSRGQVFTVMSSGFAAAAGSTLVGYSLLGAPLEYLLAATVMNAPAGLLMAKIIWPDPARPGDEQGKDSEPEGRDARAIDVRTVRDEESANAIDALGRGALAGGRIAVVVGAMLIAFVGLIALANGLLSGIGGWFGYDDLTFQQALGWVLAPLAWLLGVPWSEADQAGSFIGQKTVLNEFIAYAEFGPLAEAGDLSAVTVVIVTFALAGFANFSSIAIQIGTISSLQPELRPTLARLGLLALLAGSLANLANAAIAGVVVSI